MRPLLATIAIVTLGLGLDATAAVNLRVSDDEMYQRPNSWSSIGNAVGADQLYAEGSQPLSRPGVSIAWRNANQVEEVEVRLQNTGDTAGEGRVSVDVLDAEGKVLLRLQPPPELQTIRIPAYDRGGREGKIIRMQASWELNALIDRFDRTRTQYGVRATIETLGEDADWSDNSKTKEWNAQFRVNPSQTNVFNYTFTNPGATDLQLKWRVDQSKQPPGWNVQGLPSTTKPFVLRAGEKLSGTLMMKAPAKPLQGEFLETRVALVDAASGKVVQQHEWFQVYDEIPPTVSNYRAVLLSDHTLAIQALISDQHSGVLEATGVRTEFSVDNGRTWAVKAHNYKVGNFIRPTLFETVLGPFAPGTRVLVRLTALDTAGNPQSVIPDDASAFFAPRGAEQLIQQAYVFPRTQRNPVFELEKLQKLNLTLAQLKSSGVDVLNLDLTAPNALGLDPQRLQELGLDQQRLADLKEDLARVSDLNFDVGAITAVPMRRVQALGQGDLPVTTLEFEIK